jgi:hypothetical protein
MYLRPAKWGSGIKLHGSNFEPLMPALGHSRHSCNPDVSGSPQERTLAVGDARGLMGEILQWLWSATIFQRVDYDAR